MRNGRCTNFDDSCAKFRSKELIALPEPADFVCPECGRELMAVAPAPGLGERLAKAPTLVKVAALVLPIVGLLGFGAIRLLGSGAEGVPRDAAVEAVPVSTTADSSSQATKVLYEDTAGRSGSQVARVPKERERRRAPVDTRRTRSEPAGSSASSPRRATAEAREDRPVTAGVPYSPPPATAAPATPASANAATAPASSAASVAVTSPPVERTSPPLDEAPPPTTLTTAPAARVARTLERNTEVHVRPVKDYCMRELKRNGLISFALADPVPLSDGSTLPAGMEVMGRIVAREAADVPDEPDRLRVALTSLAYNGEDVGVSSGQLALQMRRQSATGKVIKYSIIGAVVGGVGATLLKKDPVVGVAVGAGGGAIVGGIAAANQDACMVAKQTILPFRLTQEAVLR